MHLYLATFLFVHVVMFVYFALITMALSAAAGAKILAIATAVYMLLQTAKKIFPSIGGGWAIALNFGLTALGFLVTVPAASLFSIDTLAGLIMAVAASAGIHGTVKSVTAAS